MENFLSEQQKKVLTIGKWDIAPTPKYLTLYPEDFVQDIESWNQVCDQLCVPYDSPHVHILFIATKLN
jgi:hypothetical protein